MLRDIRHFNVFPGEFEGELDEIEFDERDEEKRAPRSRVGDRRRRLASTRQKLVANKDKRDELITENNEKNNDERNAENNDENNDSTEQNPILSNHITAMETEVEEARREDYDCDRRKSGFEAAEFLY